MVGFMLSDRLPVAAASEGVHTCVCMSACCNNAMLQGVGYSWWLEGVGYGGGLEGVGYSGGRRV